MSNVNSIADVILQQNAGQPIVLAFGSAVGHKQVMLGAGAALLTVPNPMGLVDSALAFPGRAATSLPFVLRAAGLVTAPGAGNFQIDINLGTTLAPAIFSTGNTRLQTAGAQNDNWLLEVECMWDPTSLNLRGIGYGWVGSLSVAQTALVSNTAANLAALVFNLGVTFLNANSLNSVTVTEFSSSID